VPGCGTIAFPSLCAKEKRGEREQEVGFGRDEEVLIYISRDENSTDIFLIVFETEFV
jgi:hypothetical protein